MSCLCQDIKETQREAAGMSTNDLKFAVSSVLDMLETSVELLDLTCQARPVGRQDSQAQLGAAYDIVVVTALLASLYVRELTRRPAEQPTRVWFSRN
jgi:hypothetical protein